MSHGLLDGHEGIHGLVHVSVRLRAGARLLELGGVGPLQGLLIDLPRQLLRAVRLPSLLLKLPLLPINVRC